GGGHALRMTMLDEIGDWPAQFFFAHEETDLAWRAVDAGWRILYAPELLLQHPKTSPARHAIYFRVTARNRVWLVRRRLPLVLVPVHLGVWVLLTLARTRSARGLRAWFGGFLEGLREPAGERRAMRWRTVWRLTRLGRQPVILSGSGAANARPPGLSAGTGGCRSIRPALGRRGPAVHLCRPGTLATDRAAAATLPRVARS